MRPALLRPTVLFALVLSLPAPAARASAPGPNRTVRLQDLARLDPNQLSLVLSNLGSIAFDLENGTAGLEYPTGSGKYAVFAAGLWIVANVGNDVHAAIAEYSMEYVPGPMAGGTFHGTLQSATWDPRAGASYGALAPGLYWAVLSSEGRRVVRRVVVLDR
jgi:hypothetical protein